MDKNLKNVWPFLISLLAKSCCAGVALLSNASEFYTTQMLTRTEALMSRILGLQILWKVPPVEQLPASLNTLVNVADELELSAWVFSRV